MQTLPNGIKKVEPSDNAVIENFNRNCELLDQKIGKLNDLQLEVGDMSSVPTNAKTAAGAITELYNTKETPAGAQAKADAVQANLNVHIGSGGLAHASATTSAAGFMSASDKAKLDSIQAGAQVNSVTSVAGKTGAVTLTKSDVGLANVPNYPAATQAQAEAGADNASLMTPLRTKQYMDTRLQGNLLFRLNNGVLEYSTDGGVTWKTMGMDYFSMTPNVQNYRNNSNLSVPPGGYLDLISISGKGLLMDLQAIGTDVSNSNWGLAIVVDDVEMPLYTANNNFAIGPLVSGGIGVQSMSSTYGMYNIKGPIRFNSSLKIRFKNQHSSNTYSNAANSLSARTVCMMA